MVIIILFWPLSDESCSHEGRTTCLRIQGIMFLLNVKNGTVQV